VLPEDGFSGYKAEGSPTPGVARWGDYSAAVAADGAFWMGNEFIPGTPRTLRSFAVSFRVAAGLTLPAGKRYAFIGDVAWQLEGVRRPAERPLMMRKLADADPGQVREDLLRVASLAGLMQVVPAHDLTTHEGIPRLAARATSSIS